MACFHDVHHQRHHDRTAITLLIGDIKAELVNSGVVQLATTYAGVSGRPQDQDAAANARKKAFRNQSSSDDATPDFSLTGTIMELSSRAGNTYQLDLQFQMTLTSWSNDLAQWTDTKKVSKQGRQAFRRTLNRSGLDMEQLGVDPPLPVSLEHREGVDEHHAQIGLPDPDAGGFTSLLAGEDLEHLLGTGLVG